MIRQLLSPSHSYFSFGIICGRLWGSLAVEDDLRSTLGIICGLGISCGWGSFAVLYSSDHKPRPHLFQFILYAVYGRPWSSHHVNPTRHFLFVIPPQPSPQAFFLASLSDKSLIKALCQSPSLSVTSRRVHVWRNGEGLGTWLILFLSFPKMKE